ncbi:hypothetical protein [Bifidobacterium leontopitheci]|uniref:hypothetical protein n=1 Tax=Bifidobacterium leontopitheci TaxID=2650774 RepID=UPI001263F4D0|nr:hypothetical protein [Bifidobacterium leontopitheci]
MHAFSDFLDRHRWTSLALGLALATATLAWPDDHATQVDAAAIGHYFVAGCAGLILLHPALYQRGNRVMDALIRWCAPYRVPAVIIDVVLFSVTSIVWFQTDGANPTYSWTWASILYSMLVSIEGIIFIFLMSDWKKLGRQESSSGSRRHHDVS